MPANQLSRPVLAVLLAAPVAGLDSLNGLRSAVSPVGDVNQDGVLDLAVASRDRGRGARVWIVSGKDGAKLVECKGREPSDAFGSEVVGIGDWNADGVPDLLVAAGLCTLPEFTVRHGYRTIHSGRDGTALHTIEGTGAIGGARDVDGDGRVDLLLGAGPAATIVSGGSGRDLLRIQVDSERAVFDALAWVGDVDHDGAPDFASSEHGSLPNELGVLRESWRVSLRSSRTGQPLWSIDVPGLHNLQAGYSILRAMDADDDDVPDVVHCIEDDALRVFSGKDGERRWEHRAPRHVLFSTGSSMDVIGDLDRDGIDDLLVGANESPCFFDAGYAFVRSTRRRQPLISLPESHDFGFDVCRLGDVNGDDLPDFAVNAERQRSAASAAQSEPSVSVHSGKDASVLWRRLHTEFRR